MQGEIIVNIVKSVFVLQCVLLLAASSANSETLMWLRFEDGSAGSTAEAITDSAESFPGMAVGGPSYMEVDEYNSISGQSNSGALQFDGVDDEIADFPAFSIDESTTFTIELILRWDGIAEANNMIVQHLDGTGPGRTWMLINAETQNLRSFIGNQATEIEDEPVPIDEWFYAAVTLDNGVVAVWMDPDLSDGIQPDAYSAFNSVPVEPNEGSFVIGRHKTESQFFSGAIAEVRITDEGISEFIEEISPPDESFDVIGPDGEAADANADTIAWWRFEEGAPDQNATGSIQDYGSDGQSSGAFAGNVFGEPFFNEVDETRFINPGKLEDTVALEFDGLDDEFFAAEPVGVSASSVFTVEAIIKWFGPDGKNHAIMQQDDGIGTGRTWLFINNSDSTLRSFIGGDSTIVADPLVPIDQWIYAAVTYNEGAVAVWMDPDLSDGIQPETAWAVSEYDMEENDGLLIIGNHKAQNNLFFGEISEIRITRSGFGGFVQQAQPPANTFTIGDAVPVSDWAIRE